MNGTDLHVDRMRTILVGVDGSDEAAHAAHYAACLAAQLGADLVAAHAVGLLDVWPEHPDDHPDRNSHAHVRELLEGSWTDAIRRQGVRPRLELRDGPPAGALLDLADEIDADVLVVGSRGSGRADLYELGSTSAKIVRRSTRPVIVVPVGRPTPADRDGNTLRSARVHSADGLDEEFLP